MTEFFRTHVAHPIIEIPHAGGGGPDFAALRSISTTVNPCKPGDLAWLCRGVYGTGEMYRFDERSDPDDGWDIIAPTDSVDYRWVRVVQDAYLPLVSGLQSVPDIAYKLIGGFPTTDFARWHGAFSKSSLKILYTIDAGDTIWFKLYDAITATAFYEASFIGTGGVDELSTNNLADINSDPEVNRQLQFLVKTGGAGTALIYSAGLWIYTPIVAPP